MPFSHRLTEPEGREGMQAGVWVTFSRVNCALNDAVSYWKAELDTATKAVEHIN